jgi:hypothetical protein
VGSLDHLRQTILVYDVVHQERLAMIDVESQKVMTTISMDTKSYGMAFKGRTIYYSSWDEGLKMLNLSDESVSYLINSNMSGVYYVATFGDKLYYTPGRVIYCSTFKRHAITFRIHGDSCHDFLTFYVYHSYASAISTSR